MSNLRLKTRAVVLTAAHAFARDFDWKHIGTGFRLVGVEESGRVFAFDYAPEIHRSTDIGLQFARGRSGKNRDHWPELYQRGAPKGQLFLFTRSDTLDLKRQYDSRVAEATKVASESVTPASEARYAIRVTECSIKPELVGCFVDKNGFAELPDVTLTQAPSYTFNEVREFLRKDYHTCKREGVSTGFEVILLPIVAVPASERVNPRVAEVEKKIAALQAELKELQA